MGITEIRDEVVNGSTFLGIELGSTRIKAVLIDSHHTPVASGSYAWENSYVDHIWTYPLEEVIDGLQACYRDLAQNVEQQYGVALQRVGALGISAMMHGYLAFDKDGNLLVPFRTWRNSITGEAAEKLTELFGYNIPQRWSIAHLYQAILNGEEHVADVSYLTTLSGYIHWKLTGRRVLGIGDASGMFPIDIARKDYNAGMLDQFDQLVKEKNYPWNIRGLLPEVLTAGEDAGTLTSEGALLLDPTGTLQPGVMLCAPEGDAGTGMAATNSVAVRTGNVSAGTSIFAMLVLERELTKVYPELDLVTTPAGDLVAMVHANNCTSDINAWAGIFREFARDMHLELSNDRLFTYLFEKAMEGDADCGQLLSYCYLSGENITEVENGRPMFVRMPDSRFTLGNFMRTHLYSALGALKIGMDILLKEENASLDRLMGHGGFFKTPKVGQQIMADAMEVPVSVMETAGEGGAWGIALLAAYRKNRRDGETLDQYLNSCVFNGVNGSAVKPDLKGSEGFHSFMERYRNALPAERAASETLI